MIRLEELPADWNYDRFKDIAELRIEKTREKSRDRDYLELEDIEQGTGKLLSTRSTEDVDSAVTKFYKGDVLFGKLRPYLEKYWLAEFDGKCTGELLAFRAERITPQFLKYCVASTGFTKFCVAMSYGAKMPRVNWPKQLATINLPLPPPEEQIRIAQYLDQTCAVIDRSIAVKRQQLEKLGQLRKSIIYKAVTKGLDNSVEMMNSGVEWIGEIPTHWGVKRIKRFAKTKRGASPRPIDDPKYFDDDGEFAWVRIADVSASGRYLKETTQSLSELGAFYSVKQYPGDLIISIAASVGKPIIAEIKCCIHDGFVWFENPTFDKDYLYFIFLSEMPYQGLGKIGTQLNLNTDTIGQIFIPEPPNDEVKEIINNIEIEAAKIENVGDILLKQVNTLDAYKKSLIHECVTGKRRVTQADLDQAA